MRKISLKNILVSLAVLVLIALAVLLTGDYRSFIIPGNDRMPVSDTARVMKISIIGEDSLVLSRKNGSQWLVNGKFQAEPVAVSNLLYALSHLEIIGKMHPDTSDAGLRRIIVETKNMSRTWFLLPNENNPVLFRMGSRNFNIVKVKGAKEADLAELTNPDPGEWRNRQWISLLPDEIQRVEVQVFNDWGHGFVMYQSGDGFRIESPEGVPLPDSLADKEAMLLYSSYFRDVYYDSVVKDEKTTARVLSSDPIYTIVLRDVEGTEYRLDIYPKADEDGQKDLFRAYVRFNRSEEVFIVPYIVLDLLMQTLEHFTMNGSS